MSYLNLAKGIPDFSKAVISVWFRVPHQTIAAAKERENLLFPGIIPLITFGKPQIVQYYTATIGNINVWHFTPSGGQTPTMGVTNFTPDGGTDPVNPCFIGVDCNGDQPTLTFNIQMGDTMPAKNVEMRGTQFDIYSNVQVPPSTVEPIQAGDGWINLGYGYGKYTITDFSYIINGQPEFFLVETVHELEPDQWHHLLLSFDLSGTCSIGQPGASSTCKLWYAIDDVDYQGADNLQPFRRDDDGLDPNIIITANAFHYSSGAPGPRLYLNQWVPAPSGTYTPKPIPSKDAELGTPASTKYVNNVFRIELAEFQMWTDATLDSAKTDNRRAFIDYERDEDGEIIVDDSGKGTLKPVNPKRAEELLGKRQDVMLHGSNNWTTGYNTGSTGVEVETDADGNEVLTKIPEGQFQPIAKIRRYKPDPSLSKSPGG